MSPSIRAAVDRGKGKPGVLTSEERTERAKLRKEVRELRIERDIPKKPRRKLDEALRAAKRQVAARRRGSNLTQFVHGWIRTRAAA